MSEETAPMNNWYTNPKHWGSQAAVADEQTGRTIAVVYDPRNALLVAAAPALKKALTRLELAAIRRETPMGDPCDLIECKAELAAAAKEAQAVLYELEERS